MCAIVANTLFTSLLRRGTTRQLSGAIVVCVIAALFLLPALVWYNLRFHSEQEIPPLVEIVLALAYTALWGGVVPLSVTAGYCLFTQPRLSTTSTHIPSQKRSTNVNKTSALLPPRYQPGVIAPFVFGEDAPWGWLEYCQGRFQGQRLALKRSIITIGRDEDNDIWLDDDMASRHHAELAWDQGHVYVTDCDSLNGVLLNGRRIRGSALLEANEQIEVGSHRFIFIPSERSLAPSELSDPLAHHKWHSATENITESSNVLAATKPLQDKQIKHPETPMPDTTHALPLAGIEGIMTREWQETAELNQMTTPAPQAVPAGAMVVQNGDLEGRIFLLDRPIITLGRGIESDIVIEDTSISRRHVQFSHQIHGDYVQDLASRNGTHVNDEPLTAPRLLQAGDIVSIGNIRLEYIPIQHARTAPLPLILTPQPVTYSTSGPMPLRLPSKLRAK